MSLTVLTPESNITGSVNADIVLIGGGGGGGGGKQPYQQFLYKGNPNITGFNYSKYQLITYVEKRSLINHKYIQGLQYNYYTQC